MSDAIKGQNVLMYVNDSIEGNILFACARNCTFTPTLSLQKVTNYQSDNWDEYQPDMNGWSMAVDGLVIVNGYSYAKILRDQKARKAIEVKFSVDQGADGFMVYSGNAYITSVTISSPYDGAATYQAQLQGTGAYAVSGSIPPPPTPNPVNRLEYPTDAGWTVGSTYIQNDLLKDTVLLTCFNGGMEVMTILLSGSPTGNQVKFTSSLGRIDFDPSVTPIPLITCNYR